MRDGKKNRSMEKDGLSKVYFHPLRVFRRKRSGTGPELCNSGGEKEVSDVQYAAG